MYSVKTLFLLRSHPSLSSFIMLIHNRVFVATSVFSFGLNPDTISKTGVSVYPSAIDVRPYIFRRIIYYYAVKLIYF